MSKLITCRKCEEDLSVNYFYSSEFNKKTFRGICKSCKKSANNTYRWDNIDKIREKDRERSGYSEVSLRAGRKWRRKYPRKQTAHKAVAYALKMGKLIRPEQCEMCHSKDRIEAHHDDYLKKTDVRWLCRACHFLWHKENGEGKNGSA